MFTPKYRLQRATRSLVILDRPTAHPDLVLPFPTQAASAPPPPPPPPPLSLSLLGSCRRSHSTIASISKGHHLRLLREAFQSSKKLALKKKDGLRPGNVTLRNTRAREHNKHHLDIRKDQDASARLWASNVDRSLQTELNWTGGDALKLAQSVLDKLKAELPERALELVRASEKMLVSEGRTGVDSVVSWNHIMDYHMSKGSTRSAFKVFNEMKKRGHIPDAHTYTIMLRGFAMNHKKPSAAEDAMKVYDSMWRPESKIKPNVIHSNAIINCLGRALNMDALWSVAGRLPDRGVGAPDKWTYTTILNTMQACAIRDARQLTETDGNEEAAAKLIQKTIGEGRRLWEDIISRWKSGDVNIDQTLVCAMGRLLLLGQRRDWDDVFSLVEQTMRLPRVTLPLVHHRGREDGEGVAKSLALGQSKEEEASSDFEQLEVAVADEATSQVKNEFAAVDLEDRPVRGKIGTDVPSPYADIGSNVLSLLLEAAIKLKAMSTGKVYWDKLTNVNNQPFVAPDDDNLHSYLRLLRISRSSKTVVDLLRQPINSALKGISYRRATFVIAMSTCARDFKNPNVFTHASTVLDLMQTNLKEPDLKVMTMYLSLAMVTTPGISTEIEGQFSGDPAENNLLRAIRRFHYSDLDYRLILGRFYESVGAEQQQEQEDKGHLSYSEWRSSRREPQDQGAPAPPEELLEFLQTLNSACDKIMNHMQKLTDQMAANITNHKREISRQLQRLNPEALPPSRTTLESEDPVDAFAEYEQTLSDRKSSKRSGWSAAGKAKRSGLVDTRKGHPFLAREKASRHERHDPRLRKNRESPLWSGRGRQETRPRGYVEPLQRFGSGEAEKQRARNRASTDWAKYSLAKRMPRAGRDQESSARSAVDGGGRRSKRDQASSFMSGGDRGARRPSRDQDSSSLAEGWSNAWKRSVKDMGVSGQRKDWVVV